VTYNLNRDFVWMPFHLFVEKTVVRGGVEMVSLLASHKLYKIILIRVHATLRRRRRRDILTHANGIAMQQPHSGRMLAYH